LKPIFDTLAKLPAQWVASDDESMETFPESIFSAVPVGQIQITLKSGLVCLHVRSIADAIDDEEADEPLFRAARKQQQRLVPAKIGGIQLPSTASKASSQNGPPRVFAMIRQPLRTTPIVATARSRAPLTGIRSTAPSQPGFPSKTPSAISGRLTTGPPSAGRPVVAPRKKPFSDLLPVFNDHDDINLGVDDFILDLHLDGDANERHDEAVRVVS
jgi:hypothetical protein